MSSYESTIFEYIEMIKMQIRALPLNLGGVSTTSGVVSTGPPGGYIGYIPQYRVAYDTIEAETDATSISGVSLVDNLNHIRYRIQNLEAGGVSGGSITVIDSNTLETYTDVSIVEFDGAITSEPITNGVKITVAVSGGGDMTKAVYDTDNDGIVDSAEAVPWTGISGKPSTFAPSAHNTSHQAGGSDIIKLDDLGTPDDNTDLNATTGVHGLLPKLGGGTTNFLRADGTWAAPASGGIENRIALLTGSNTVTYYNATTAGLTSALAAAISGDTVQLPARTISGGVNTQAMTVPDGVIVRGYGWNSYLENYSFSMGMNSGLENFYNSATTSPVVTVNLGDASYVCTLRNMKFYTDDDNNITIIDNDAGIVNCWNCFFTIDDTATTVYVIENAGNGGDFFGCVANGDGATFDAWFDTNTNIGVFYGVLDGSAYSYP